jgi:hypothetical protein
MINPFFLFSAVTVHIGLNLQGYMYNFSVYAGLAKYNTQSFTPSTELPADKNNYEIILAVSYEIISGGTLTLGYDFYGQKAGNVTTNNVIGVLSVPPGTVTSTICFVAGTEVFTDNGYLPIEKLSLTEHTIHGKRILAVTETITPEKHLTLIKAGTLGEYIPLSDIKCSLNHRVLFNGSMVESYQLPDVEYVKYTGEILYNVLLEGAEIDTMTVSNMTVETLDPNNLLAKMFVVMKTLPLEQQQGLIHMCNEYSRTFLKIN